MVMLLSEDGDIITPESNRGRIKKLENTLSKLVEANNANVAILQTLLAWVDDQAAQEEKADDDTTN